MLLTRADADQAAAALAAHPDGVVTGDRHRLVAWRPAPPRPVPSWSSAPAPPTCPWPTSARPRSPPSACPPAASPTWAWPASTACWPTSTSWSRPTPWWWWPAWRAPWRRCVGGLTAAPVVAVPTSVGYGASLEGVTALLAMLSSCAAGITVVGIDNGYGAACAIQPARSGAAAAVSAQWPEPRPWPGSTASPASPATWPSAPWSTPGPTWTRSRPSSARLDVDGWELRGRAGAPLGRGATKAHVHGRRRRRPPPPHRRQSTPRPARRRRPARRVETARARRPSRLLAAAEGALHRGPTRRRHFHEVGAVDAIVDVVGTCAALEVLGVDEVRPAPGGAGPGRSTPPTATCPTRRRRSWGCWVGAGPVHGIDTPVELTTPTGAALMAALARGSAPMPDLPSRPPASAPAADRRAGRTRRQVVLGTRRRRLGARRRSAASRSWCSRPPSTTSPARSSAHAVARLLDAGALDAWITPVVMKKGRPGHVVAALADPAAWPRSGGALRTATGTLGVRAARRRALAVGPSLRDGRRSTATPCGSRWPRSGPRPSTTTWRWRPAPGPAVARGGEPGGPRSPGGRPGGGEAERSGGDWGCGGPDGGGGREASARHSDR